MTPVFSAEPMSSGTPGLGSEPMSTTQPNEPVSPVKAPESKQNLAELEQAVHDIRKKLDYVEMRLMYNDLKPHEYIRVVTSTLYKFNPESDGGWALRHIRDLCVIYNRVLSRTYRKMSPEERIHLTKLLLFEA